MAVDADTAAGEAFEAYLDGLVPAGEPARLTRIGEGSSNLTYLVERGGARVVLRRPPPPPLPPSAHDVVREARLQLALAEQGVRVPRVLAVCEDPALIGAPFYLMEALDGAVITDSVPPGTDGRALGLAVVDALAELHAVDWHAEALSRFGRPSGYLERQLSRFGALYDDERGPPHPRLRGPDRGAAARAARRRRHGDGPRRLPARQHHGQHRRPPGAAGDPRLGDGHRRGPARRPRLPDHHVVGAGRDRAPDAAQPGDRRTRLPDPRRARASATSR